MHNILDRSTHNAERLVRKAKEMMCETFIVYRGPLVMVTVARFRGGGGVVARCRLWSGASQVPARVSLYLGDPGSRLAGTWPGCLATARLLERGGPSPHRDVETCHHSQSLCGGGNPVTLMPGESLRSLGFDGWGGPASSPCYRGAAGGRAFPGFSSTGLFRYWSMLDLWLPPEGGHGPARPTSGPYRLASLAPA